MHLLCLISAFKSSSVRVTCKTFLTSSSRRESRSKVYFLFSIQTHAIDPTHLLVVRMQVGQVNKNNTGNNNSVIELLDAHCDTGKIERGQYTCFGPDVNHYMMYSTAKYIRSHMHRINIGYTSLLVYSLTVKFLACNTTVIGWQTP